MELKTKVIAESGKQDLVITREFELPVELLFRAFEEPDLIAQWMGTKVLKFEAKEHSGYRYETMDNKGNVAFLANGVIHEFSRNRKITRTFEMENTPFGVQLEILEFLRITDNTSQLNMHTIYESVEQRDQVLKLPFAWGISMAHNRLEEIMKKQK